ncbi:MAG: response regulator transcription factor [Saprospiraceae bacterium]|nr:response regulator transcription factor [Saprospiraceae bacterium]
MKRIVIIEDEIIASGRLISLVGSIRPGFEIVSTLQSVAESIEWFLNNEQPDLVFMDIQLADGLSFSIFKEVDLRSPIIFTTAYDQYALNAFKVNSIDYLLKPIDPDQLNEAIVKYESWTDGAYQYSPELLKQLIEAVSGPKYKSRFLVKSGKALQFLTQDAICFFYSESGVLFAWSRDGKRHMMDGTLEQLQLGLDPAMFFRINRKAIVHIQAIETVHPHLNSRLKIRCTTPTDIPLVVARERSSDFKHWVDGQVNH